MRAASTYAPCAIKYSMTSPSAMVGGVLEAVAGPHDTRRFRRQWPLRHRRSRRPADAGGINALRSPVGAGGERPDRGRAALVSAPSWPRPSAVALRDQLSGQRVGAEVAGRDACAVGDGGQLAA